MRNHIEYRFNPSAKMASMQARLQFFTVGGCAFNYQYVVRLKDSHNSLPREGAKGAPNRSLSPPTIECHACRLSTKPLDLTHRTPPFYCA